MRALAPPPMPPAPIALADDSGAERLRVHLTLLWTTLATILITVWLCTLGPIPAVIALVTSKHVLVAILVMGLGVDAPKRAPAS